MIRIFEDKKIACTEHISQRVAQTELPREAIGPGGLILQGMSFDSQCHIRDLKPSTLAISVLNMYNPNF